MVMTDVNDPWGFLQINAFCESCSDSLKTEYLTLWKSSEPKGTTHIASALSMATDIIFVKGKLLNY